MKNSDVSQQRPVVRLPPDVGLIALLFTVGLVTLLFTVGLVALLFTVKLVAQDAGAGFQPCRRRLPEVGRRLTRVPFAQ